MLTTTYSAVTLLGDEPDGFGDTMTTFTSTATTKIHDNCDKT